MIWSVLKPDIHKKSMVIAYYEKCISFWHTKHIYIYIYINVYTCVCVCACGFLERNFTLYDDIFFHESS
jgi:hypothetical protein